MPSTSRLQVAVLTLLAIVCARGSTATTSSTPEPTPAKPTLAGVRTELARLPTRFEENAGQTDAHVRYMAHGRGSALFLGDDGATLRLQRGHEDAGVLTLKVDGGRDVKPEAQGELVTRTNYFSGRDPSKWRTGVKNYGRVVYRGVRDGVDVVYHGEEGQLEYDFVVAPGASVDGLAMNVGGATGLSLTADGDLAIHTPNGDVVQRRPHVYQTKADGGTETVESSYRIVGDKVAFHVADYDHGRALVIDPVVGYSTYLGGTGDELAYGITVDATGNAYVTGETTSADFPQATGTAPTAIPCNKAPCPIPTQAFVAKMNSTGTALIYATYFGGSQGDDEGLSIAVDGAGRAFVTGATGSFDFPVPDTNGAFESNFSGCEDGFIARFTAAGVLDYGTFLGNGDGGEAVGQAIALDAAGDVIVGGYRGCFPTSTAFIGAGFLMKLVPGSGSHVALWSRTDLTGVSGIAVDSSGLAYAVGGLTGGWAGTRIGPGALTDILLSKIAPAGATAGEGAGWAYQTVIGGSGDDAPTGIAVDSSGFAYITGETDANGTGADFPTTAGAFQTTRPAAPTAPGDAFVLKVAKDGGSLVFGTLLGGSGFDRGKGIAVDAAGDVFVSGETSSPNYPVQPAGSTAPFGGQDVFVTELAPSGASLVLSGYYGGSGDETQGGLTASLNAGNASGLAIDASGAMYITGNTASTNLLVIPGGTAFQRANAGRTDAFIAKLGIPPLVISPPNAGVAPHGTVAFTASGGVGVGYAFTLKTNGSGATINPTTGAYTAGATGNSTDVVQVSDPTGATATATVTVSSNLAINPAAASIAPKGGVSFTATGGAPPYSFSLAANSSGASIGVGGGYVAGANGNTTDIVRVTDAAGASATAIVTVTGPVVIKPAAPEAAPLGTIAFSATGGSGAGYTWSITQNKSGGSISPSTGVYHAGGSAAVDTVGVTDSLGNSASVNVSVGGALAISPADPSTAPLGALTFTAAGGSHFYTWSISTNASGGSIDPTTGDYRAGATGNVVDVVSAQDTNGATASVSVTVGPAIAITPTSTAVSAGAFVNYTVTGGAGKYAFSFESNASGATLDPQTGVYQAGPKGGDDHLRVTDANGAFAQAVVGVSVPPAPPPNPPSTFTPPTFNPGGNNNDSNCSCRVVGDNHSSRTPALVGGLVLGLALLARRRRR